jgi:hypothetical protein
MVCAGGRSRVKPLVPIVAYRWFALVYLTGQAGFYAGGRMAKVRGVSLLASVLADTAGRSEESSVVIAAAVGCFGVLCSTASGMCCALHRSTPAEQGLAR